MENPIPLPKRRKLREGLGTLVCSRHDLLRTCSDSDHKNPKAHENSPAVASSDNCRVVPHVVEDDINDNEFQSDDGMETHLFYKHRLKRNISLSESDVVKEKVKYLPSFLLDKDQVTEEEFPTYSKKRNYEWPAYPSAGMSHEVNSPKTSEKKEKKKLPMLAMKYCQHGSNRPFLTSDSKTDGELRQNDRSISHSNYRENHPQGLLKKREETEYFEKNQHLHEDSVTSISRIRQSSPTETNPQFVETSLMHDSSVLKYRVDDESCEKLTLTKSDVKVTLLNSSLWKAFNSVGTEMIINRGGRRMFPYLALSVSGLKPDALYSVTLEILPASTSRFKYISSKWMPVGLADTEPNQAPYVHPDSPSTGLHFSKVKIIFSKVKLTNNKDFSDGNVLLHSMNKYRLVTTFKLLDSKRNQPRLSFTFPETDFIAVTAYQNEAVTQMKIHNNPFAKAFRDSPLTAVRRGISSRRKRHPILSVSSRDKHSGSHDRNPFKRFGRSEDSETSPIPSIVSSLPTSTSLSSSSSLLAGSGYWPLFQQDPGQSIQDKAIHAVGVPYLMPWMNVYPSLFHPTLYPSFYPPVTSTISLEPASNNNKETDASNTVIDW